MGTDDENEFGREPFNEFLNRRAAEKRASDAHNRFPYRDTTGRIIEPLYARDGRTGMHLLERTGPADPHRFSDR